MNSFTPGPPRDGYNHLLSPSRWLTLTLLLQGLCGFAGSSKTELTLEFPTQRTLTSSNFLFQFTSLWSYRILTCELNKLETRLDPTKGYTGNSTEAQRLHLTNKMEQDYSHLSLIQKCRHEDYRTQHTNPWDQNGILGPAIPPGCISSTLGMSCSGSQS